MLRPADGPVDQPALANGPAASVLAPSVPPASTTPAGPTGMPPPKLQAAPMPVSGSGRAGTVYATAIPRNPAGHAIRPAEATGRQPHSPLGRRDRACRSRHATTTRIALRFRSTSASEPDGHAATAVATGTPPVVPMAPVQQRTPGAPRWWRTSLQSSPLTSHPRSLAEPIDSSTQPAIPAVPKSRKAAANWPPRCPSRRFEICRWS